MSGWTAKEDESIEYEEIAQSQTWTSCHENHRENWVAEHGRYQAFDMLNKTRYIMFKDGSFGLEQWHPGGLDAWYPPQRGAVGYWTIVQAKDEAYDQLKEVQTKWFVWARKRKTREATTLVHWLTMMTALHEGVITL